MAKSSGIIDWEKLAETGDDVAEIVRYLPPERVVQILGADKMVQTVGADKTLDALLKQVSPEQLQEMLKQRQQPPAPPAEG